MNINQRKKVAVITIIIMLCNLFLSGFAQDSAVIIENNIFYNNFFLDENNNADDLSNAPPKENPYNNEIEDNEEIALPNEQHEDPANEDETQDHDPNEDDHNEENNEDELTPANKEEPHELNLKNTPAYINFPDNNFSAFLAAKYGDGTGITKQQAANVTQLNVKGQNITDLQGIEHFTNLTKLDCSDNGLTILDVSKNTKLTELICGNNQINILNVTACSMEGCGRIPCPRLECPTLPLTYLDFSNNALATVNISRLTNLKYLNASNNKLTTLDTYRNPELTDLNVSDNQLIIQLTSDNPKLERLNISNNKITSSYLNNNPVLKYYNGSNNIIMSLGFVGNQELLYVDCRNNLIRMLNTANNPKLTELYCAQNNLSLLDISANVLLKKLDLTANKLTHLDITKNTDLEYLNISNNRLAINFDLSNNKKLTYLNVSDNYLESAARTAFINQAPVGTNVITTPQVETSFFHLHYHANGAPNAVIPSSVKVSTSKSDRMIMVTGNLDLLTRDGFAFIGWNTQSDGSGTNYRLVAPPFAYQSDWITLTNDTTLYATWAPMIHIKDLKLNANTLDIKVGENRVLTTAITPANATNQSITWTSSNNDVATVSSAGVVKGVGFGEATITATTADTGIGSLSAVCEVSVTNLNPVTGINPDNEDTVLRIIGETVRLRANVLPLNATDKTIIWASSNTNAVGFNDTNTHFRAKAPGVSLITGTTRCGNFVTEFYVTVKKPLINALTISASNNIAKSGDSIALNINAIPADYDENDSNFAWYLNGVLWNENNSVFQKDGTLLKVKDKAPAGIYNITIRSRGITKTGHEAIISASTAIEIYAVGSAEHKLLEANVTVNAAKISGQTVPIRITGTDVFENVKNNPASAAVRLYTDYGTNKAKELTAQSGGISAKLANNAQAIEIIAELNAKIGIIKNVKVVVAAGGKTVVLDGTVNITTQLKYPEINFSLSHALNAFYPGMLTNVIADSPDGTVKINSLTAVTPTAAGNPLSGTTVNSLRVPINGARAGNYQYNVDLSVEGYKAVSKNITTVQTLIRVVNEVPNITLSSQKIVFDTAPGTNRRVVLKFRSANQGRTLDDFGTITGIELWGAGNTVRFVDSGDGNLSLNGIRGEVSLGRFAQSGTSGTFNYHIRVYMQKNGMAGRNAISIPLQINWVDFSVTKPSLKADRSSIVLNTYHSGDIATVDLTPNVNGAEYTGWQVVKGSLPTGVSMESGTNRIRLFTNGQALKNGNNTVEINAVRNGVNVFGNNISIAFSVTDKDAAFSLISSGRIDIADPNSQMGVFVRLSNTSAKITAVELYNSDEFINGDLNPHLEIVEMTEKKPINGNMFHIRARDGNLSTGRAPHRVFVKIYLENHSILKSEITGRTALTITPIQSSAMVKMSNTAVSLNSHSPTAADNLRITLTSPVNSTIGAVTIAESTSNVRLGFADVESGFEINNTAKDVWSIGFKNGVAPANLRSSYNLVLEIWQEGTFRYDNNGNIIKNGNANPIVRRVRVNIRCASQKEGIMARVFSFLSDSPDSRAEDITNNLTAVEEIIVLAEVSEDMIIRHEHVFEMMDNAVISELSKPEALYEPMPEFIDEKAEAIESELKTENVVNNNEENMNHEIIIDNIESDFVNKIVRFFSNTKNTIINQIQILFKKILDFRQFFMIYI